MGREKIEQTGITVTLSQDSDEELTLDTPQQADVVIVGGGPIGLAHAWGLKKLNPDLQVVVLEKYQEYQRKHTLIMQPRQLQKLLRATGAENDPVLCQLMADLNRDKHIRTSDLEARFKAVALSSGVSVVHENVQEVTAEQQILRFNPKMIIGADGTHSVVSRVMFPEDNQIKHPFDYVMQVRFEIAGDGRAAVIGSVDFYQQMARQGLIASEYVGRYDEEKGTTPVTMQLMIDKRAFDALQNATSKDPLLPFAPEKKNGMTMTEVPQQYQQFVNRYLTEKIKSAGEKSFELNRDSIRISVNEAPATHAEQVKYTFKGIPVLLVGDAGLGLSYFKGLNAGIESTAQLFTSVADAVRDALNIDKMQQGLQQYQNWFTSFAAKKIQEVKSYSTWRIRAAMRVIKVVQGFKNASMVEDEADLNPVLTDYFNLVDGLKQGEQAAFRLYPHRSYDPVKLGQYSHVPVIHSLKKIWKLFEDYKNPYKGWYQVRQDFAQPLVGIVNAFSGSVKIIGAVFTLNGKRLADGLFTLTRGVLELATTPWAWTVKPLFRGLVSVFSPPVLIEKGSCMQTLASLGHKKLDAHDFDDDFIPTELYAVKAVCNDLHRKFQKADRRDQRSLNKEEEKKRWDAMEKSGPYVSSESARQYFSLFRPAAKSQEQEVSGLSMGNAQA